MMSLQSAIALNEPSRFGSALSALAAEVLAFAAAVLNPGRFAVQGEQIRALQLQAAHLESADPAGAEALRHRASRIGLN